MLVILKGIYCVLKSFQVGYWFIAWVNVRPQPIVRAEIKYRGLTRVRIMLEGI